MLSFYTVPSLQFVIMYQLPTAPLTLLSCLSKRGISSQISGGVLYILTPCPNSFPKEWVCYLSLSQRVNESVVSSLWDRYSGITTRSITSALVKPKLVTSINAVKQTDFILSIKCRGLLLRYALLIAFAFVLLLSSRDLLKVSTQPLYASVHATMFHSLLRKVSHIVSIKSGHSSRLTQSHNV
jgi:hypothetical protein